MATEFTLRQLRYFIAVAEARSLSAAAERLFISQPALSSAITELEAAVGVQLCVRQKSRGVQLTPNGASFYEGARQLVRQADELAWSTRSEGGPLRGPLTIGIYVALAPELLPHYLIEFPKRHPGVTLNYVEGSTDELSAALAKGEIDVAVMYNLDLDPTLARTTLFQRSPHLLLSQDHRLAERDGIRLADLRDEPFIQIETSPASTHAAALFADAQVVPDLRYRVKTAELAQQLVSTNLGFAILLSFPRRGSVYRDLGLVQRRILPTPTPVGVVAAWPARVEPNARTTAFVDFLRESALPDADDKLSALAPR